MGIRITFQNDGIGLGNRKVRETTDKSMTGTTLCFRKGSLYLDDFRVARMAEYGEGGTLHLPGLNWAFDRYRVETFTPAAAAGVWSGKDEESAACMSCGREVWHINDPQGRGTAWTCGQRKPDGGIDQYLYCNKAECAKTVWECVNCRVDIIGDVCHCCQEPRAKVERGPGDD